MLEASQERTDAVREHSEGASHTEATHVLTTHQGQTLMFYTESLKEQHMRKLLGQLRTDSGISNWLQGTTIS
jgi:hypothetical protein